MVQLLYYSMYIKSYVEQENYVKFVASFRETGDKQVLFLSNTYVHPW